MKNFSILLLLLSFVPGFAQTVNLFNPADNVTYPSQLYFCTGENFNVKVDAVASSTGDYAISKLTDFNLADNFVSVPFSNKVGNDHFSNAIPLGFIFSFYGQDYTKVVVGSNGRLVFSKSAELDLLNTNTYKDQIHSGNNSSSTQIILPSSDYNKVYAGDATKELPLAQIFGGYTDLGYYNSSYYDKITYGTGTYQGINGILISFKDVLQSTSGTGYDKPLSIQFFVMPNNRIIIKVIKNNREKNAILGIQNSSGTKFKVPTHSTAGQDYNNGEWNSEGVAFQFTPNQNLTPQYKWFRNGVAVPGQISSTFNTTSFGTPLNDGDILKVEVTYLEDPTILKTGQLIFKKIPKPVITYNSGAACVSGVTMSVVNNPDLSYEWYRTGNATVLGTGNSYYATQNGDYFVRAKRTYLPSCVIDADPVTVNLNSTIPPFNANNVSFNYCDKTGATSRIINLYDYYPKNPSYTLNFIDGVTTIADPANYSIVANTEKIISIYVNDPVSGCTINQNFTIRFDSVPNVVNNLPKKYCFGETSVDVSQYLQDLAGSNFGVFDFQYSTDGTNYSTNSIVNPKQFAKIWVKISPKNIVNSSCSTISTLVFTEQSKVIANAPTTQLAPQCASSTQTFDLASLFPQINADPNVTITFHKTLIEAESGLNPVPNNFRSGLNYTTLYIRVVDNITGCVSPDHPTITLLVYLKPTLLVNSLQKSNCQGNTIFNLTQNASDLTNAQSPVTVQLAYYSTNGTLLTAAQVLNYDASIFGVKPYIKVVYNTTCNDTVAYNLIYNPKPQATSTQILICNEVTYVLQDFQNSVINNSSQYTFTDINGNPLPASFNVTVLPKTVQFLLKDKTTGCTSDVQSITFVKGGNSALLNTQATITKCDTDFDGKTNFNLNDVKTEFTTDPDAVFEYFKDAIYTQSITADYTNENPFTQKIYVRITLPNFCPSSAEINLIVNTPTKSSTLLEKYFVCYNETVNIDAGFENKTFKWSTGETTQTVDFKIPGSYSVLLTNAKGCFYTHNFTVSDENQPKIDVINQTNNSIEVVASGGVKPYQYYFNGVAQTSNILQNPTQTSYEIQVRSATGCFGPPKTVYFIKINNAFTPNADGVNDTWKIENLDKMEQVSIIIVDRAGTKVFESKNPAKSEWDGKNLGRSLATSTYWYAVSWFDPVTQKNEQRQGWILLKNRN